MTLKPASPCAAVSTSTMLGSDALGIGPYGDNYWDLTVRDGEIVSAESQCARI